MKAPSKEVGENHEASIGPYSEFGKPANEEEHIKLIEFQPKTEEYAQGARKSLAKLEKTQDSRRSESSQ